MNIIMKFGTIEPQTEYRREGNAMVCYSRAIHRDINGVIEKVTEWEPLSKITNWAKVFGSKSVADVERELP